MTLKKDETTIAEEHLLRDNIKRIIYKSSRIEIITETPLDDKNEYGFLQNDIPEYAQN